MKNPITREGTASAQNPLPDRPDQRGTMTRAGTLVLLNPEPTFEAIESAGGRVAKHAEAHVLAGFFFVSGEIERVTSYEAGLVGLLAWRGSPATVEKASIVAAAL